MLFKSGLVTAVLLLQNVAGYVLPSSGVASTTQFYLGPELSGGTACGVNALPNGQSASGRQGGGPGYLYVCLTACGIYHLLMSHRLPSINWLLARIPQSLEEVVPARRVAYATGSLP
jgi:hypothetical protein